MERRSLFLPAPRGGWRLIAQELELNHQLRHVDVCRYYLVKHGKHWCDCAGQK